jgi:hypothetical protein
VSLFISVSRVGESSVGIPWILKLFLVQGLYSTLIVILVCFQKSPIDHYTMHLARMQMFDKMYDIRRESVSVNNSESETQVPSAVSASSLDEGKSISTGNLNL